MITQKEDRYDKLISYGVPKEFLDGINSSKQDEELEYLLVAPDGSYFYLKDICNQYSILKGYEITPIYEGANGDTFWVLLSNEEEYKFVHFELEQDEIYDDYGKNFNHLLADFIIKFYDSAVDLELEEIIKRSAKLGFVNANKFLHALQEADKNGLRKTFETDDQWRAENIKLYI